ncbi:hypothetical protein C8Q77DRAFT_1101977 [Trametes polyzona]|nr:hypothetical protein C8Q77DRAFT_1101977 [Trametes polyzona]
MNVNQLQPPPQPPFQRTSAESSEKDADFLALRLLNKRSRLRLSPQALDLEALPGKGRLFAVANRAGWFAAAVRNTDSSYALVLSPLADLHSVFSSSSSDGPLTIQPRVSIPLSDIPHIVIFNQDEARLLVASANGSLSVYDSQALLQSAAPAGPLHVFAFSDRKPLRDILPNPGDAELVALVRVAGDALPVELLDVQKMSSIGGWSAGGSPATTPVSASWSPKGKQIAIGLESGDIVAFIPTDTSAVKGVVPRPQSLEGQSIISTTWLSRHEFHAIYAPAGQFSPDVEQNHYVLSADSKTNTATDIKLNCPYLSFPGLRPPGSFVVTLRDWEPSRLLLFIGDSTSSDIGLLGSLSGSGPSESWYNLTLEETSTPSVPLDADMNETVLLGLELDLTNNKPFKYTGPSGEDTDVPPPPIMYLYASDGTLTGWHIIQTQGVAYPGMATSSATPASISPAVSSSSSGPQTQSPFAAPASTSAQANHFGSTTPSPGPTVGFGAFSGAPAKFGNTSFGFGAQTSPSHSLQAPALSTPTMSVEMASATEDNMVSETDSGLGGMSLGGGDSNESSQAKSGGGTTSMFGTFGSQQQNTASSSPFGSGATNNSAFAAYGSGPLKPATGFGAFGGSGGTSAFGSSNFGGGGAFSSGGGAFSGGASAFSAKPAANDASTSTTTGSKPASGFGQSSFGQSSFGQPSAFGANAAKPAFGQSTFGQSSFGQAATAKPAFGQSTFGSSSFGATPAAAKPAASGALGSSSGGGFAAFASAPTSFASAAQQSGADSKPVWASGSSQSSDDQKPKDTPASTGSAFGGGSTFGSAKPAEATNAFASAKSAESTGNAFAPAKPAESASSAFAPAKPAESSTGGAFSGLGQGTQGSAFGKSSFGQSSFGQSSFGQSSFGQSSFGQSSFGQPSSGQAATGPVFGQSGFGQSAFGKTSFGQSSTPASTPPKAASSAPTTGGFASFASAPSAFGATAAQKSPSNESKPVWATASTEKPKEEQESKSAFSSATNSPSAFGVAASPTPASSTTPASSPEKPITPATPVATPPATPATKSDAASSTTPATTPATPAQSGGAFGGLATSTSAFPKLQAGFGAFGSTTPSLSPFSQQKPSTSSGSVFGQTSFGAVKTEGKDTTKPPSAFGTPSPLGQSSFFGKSSFGSGSSPFGKPASAAAAASTSTPAASAFSAFSNAASPFAAAASGPKKSFGDMLREKEGDAKEEKPQAVSKTAEEWKKPVSVFASLKQAATTKDEDEEDDVGNTSFRSQDDDEDAEEGSDAGDDGIDDFLKSDEEDEGSDEVEEEEEGEEEGEESATTQAQTPPESPTAKQPLPKQGSSSTFGGGFLSKDASKSAGLSSPSSSSVPTVKVEPESPTLPQTRQKSTTPPGSPSDRTSPAPESPTPADKGKARARDASTTPPGSPAVPPARATSAPPVPPPSTTPVSGHLGVGRPSTRPARSSPLANQPISGDDVSDEEEDEEDEDGRVSRGSSPKKARSASPAVPPAGKGAAAQPTSRPKTPPLLFGMGGPAKPPTPSPFSLSPGTPSLFGAKTPATPQEKPTEPTKASPPATTPSPSLKGPGTPGTPSIFGAPPVFTPPAAPQGGLFGQKPTAPTGGLFGQKSDAPAGVFGQKPETPAGSLFGQKATPPAFGSPSLFSSPAAPTTAKPPSPAPAGTTPAGPAAAAPSSVFGSGAFGTPTPAAKASPFGTFGKPPAVPAGTPAVVPPVVPQQPAPPSQAAVAQGMQTECLYLFSTLAKELEDLKALATRASARAAQLNKPGTGHKTAQDLSDPTKWILSDLTQFKEIMKEVERELEKWEKAKAACISDIRELESEMLKATTRKEEIARFYKASQDTEFARMLKARTLSPEHLETQAQLRREIRTLRGRLQQLEDHIQASKKKLNSVKNGKPSLKPPSLDTINRTYRNIDIAIEQEEEDVSTLADRVARLHLTSNASGKLAFSASTRDKRLPDRAERVGREVTPNIAASTAAALNAERSAQKLKRALLKARKEPLLNTKAVNAMPPEREVRTPRKPLLAPESGLGVGAAFAAGLNNGFPPSVPGVVPVVTPPVWTPPPPGSFGTSIPAWSSTPATTAEQDPPPPRLGAMRGSKEKHHSRSVQPAQGAAKPPPPPPPAGFSWGPLPKFEQSKQTIPGFTSFASVKTEPQVKVKDEEKDLGSSWIADGFGGPKK